MEDLIGQRLGPYQIISLLGQGGMAVVYLAQDVRYSYNVALKVLPPYSRQDPAFTKRFLKEVETARTLIHHNIVRVYEAGEERGYLYMAMEYLDGGSLQQRLEAGRPLDLAVTDAVVAQVGSALDVAHARGVIHRDVKPGNILFARDGRIVLSDFGIAKLRRESSRAGRGQIPGVVSYLSPEQAKKKAATALSDLWALGVVLYQMVTGRLPFSGDHDAVTLYNIIHKPAPSPAQVNPALPPGVEPVILRALAKEPQARFQSGAEMAAALRQAITPPPQPPVTPVPPPTPPSPIKTPTPPPGKSSMPVLALLGILALAVVGIFGALFLSRGIPGPSGAPTPTPTSVSLTMVSPTPVLPTVTLAPTQRTPTQPPATATPIGPGRPTATVAPRPTGYGIPLLIAPAQGERFYENTPAIELSWQAVGVLAADEFYDVYLTWRAGGQKVEKHWYTQVTRFVVGREYFGLADGERYEWNIVVRRGQHPNAAELSRISEQRFFLWQPRQVSPLPTPTKTLPP